ncbi:flagellar type III secretion system pore protein FliP [Polynucleobacter sp. AP-Kolm-20A-A1]|uniref:flagellar type III secretion system pore protein FliP n=1 Tax=Polynucleobacter sp. AP-Kolm-20A-A1 TaxID=2081041 RepID=UPI001BFE9BA2|nr:flagellar type III secretion system pore protein FliP [Polynucleobacter sp. AP-Kolm-20A-A1]QWE19938.1 flagellar type III secretion system pore protein FliP [Polynucleobacter sp. AP-Kolm-20A-A1]
MKRRHYAWLGAALLLLVSGAVFAQSLPLVTSGAGKGGTTYSIPVQTVIALTALSILPAALMLMTSFTRILIVFSLLRQALGLQSMPPNMVLIGLSFFLTLFVMNPTFETIYQDAYLPYTQQKISFEKAVEVGAKPIKSFMLKQTRQEDLAVFVRLYDKPIQAKEDVPMTVLIPAFAISEIKTGFLIGFMIYLPFIAIDFAVASILTSLGMVMISPMMFSLPLKLVIFALADGWALLAASLIESYKVF